MNSPYLAVPPAVIPGLSHHIRLQSQPRMTMAYVPLHVLLLPNIPSTHLWPLPDPMMYREPQPCWSCCPESLLTEDLEGDRWGGHEGRTGHRENPCPSVQGYVQRTCGEGTVESTTCHLLQHPQSLERTCREDMWGVPKDMWRGHVESTTCCSTHRLAGRADSENMRGGHAGNITHEAEKRT